MLLVAIVSTSLALLTPTVRASSARCADPVPDVAEWWAMRAVTDGMRPRGVTFPQAPRLASAPSLRHLQGRFRLRLTHTIGALGRVDSGTVTLVKASGHVRGSEHWLTTLSVGAVGGSRPRSADALLVESDGRVTLVVGPVRQARRDGVVLVTKHGPGVFFYVFDGDSERLWGRWVDSGQGGAASGPAQGWFCMEKG